MAEGLEVRSRADEGCVGGGRASDSCLVVSLFLGHDLRKVRVLLVRGERPQDVAGRGVREE